MDQVVILRNMRPVAATPRRQFITLSARTVERLRVAADVAGVLRKVWRGLHVSEILPTFAASSTFESAAVKSATPSTVPNSSVAATISSVPCGALMRPLPQIQGGRQRGAELSFVPTPSEIINKVSKL